MPVARGGTFIVGDDEARFWSKTKRIGGCLVWTAGVDDEGYGKFATGPSRNQKHFRAHRWIFERLVRPLRDDEILRHRCDNRPCCDVTHLVPGSQLDNVHDALARGRRVQILTPDIVRSLRRVRAGGGSLRAHAAKIGIAYPTAYAAATGITWRHIR